MRKFYTVALCTFSLLAGAQVQDFKLMTYNLTYYKAPSAPCPVNVNDPAKDQNFKIVFKATDPDILCVNELGAYPDNSAANSVLNNVINTDGESNFTSAAFSNNNKSSITNMLFYDSTLFVLESQSSIAFSITNQALARVIDFYRLYYKDPNLKAGADTVFFTVVAGHLKAGNTSADRDERKESIEAVMQHLTNNVADENVILCGDMNLYGSTEGAYQQMVNYSVSSEQFVDPAAAGAWNNNSAYAPLHTQSTHSSGSGCFSGGGLDDRFDFILYSKSIQSGNENLKYKFNSHKAIGNDGAHFNQSINAGTNGVVSSTVANALYNFSDHLPVVAEFEITPGPIGIDELVLEETFNYNNPFGNELVISKTYASSTTYSIFIYDLTGKMVFTTAMAGNQEELNINTARWNNGIYLMSIADKTGVRITKKLVK